MSEKFDTMSHVFTQVDIADFKRIEKEIETDQASFLRVAENLIEVRDRKLYGIVADTFEDYVSNRWGWCKQRAYQLIWAKNVVDSLPAEGKLLVDSETKARALAPVPPKRRMRVIHDAIEVSTNGKPTAREISEAAVRDTKPEPPKPSSKSEPKPEVYDMTGWPVPEPLHKLFDRIEEVKGYLKQLAVMRGMLRRMQENKDELWSPINFSSLLLQIDNVYAEIKLAAPYAVCPSCQGRDQTRTHCATCKGRGAISEFLWKNAIPEELKAVRQKSCKK